MLKIYGEKGSSSMLSKIDTLISERSIDSNTLSELGLRFLNQDKVVSRRVLEKAMMLYPLFAQPCQRMGEWYISDGEYDSARLFLVKAKELQSGLDKIDADLAECSEKMADAQKRELWVADIRENRTDTIQAENFNRMKGVYPGNAYDTGGGQKIGVTEAGGWMEYKINTLKPGSYSIRFRVASRTGEGQFELRIGDTVLTAVNVPKTLDWQNWTTVNATIRLPAGVSTLRVFAIKGGYNLNWMSFSPESFAVK
jgi:hypothetical protein